MRGDFVAVTGDHLLHPDTMQALPMDYGHTMQALSDYGRDGPHCMWHANNSGTCGHAVSSADAPAEGGECRRTSPAGLSASLFAADYSH